MTLTKAQVRGMLEPDEPDYDEAAAAGPEALPALKELLDDPTPGIASKAASLAGAIGGREAADVIKLAALATDPVVRVAAAAAASELPEDSAADVLTSLVRDADVGVQKIAIRSLPENMTPGLATAVRAVNRETSEPLLREMTDRALSGEAGGRPEETKAGAGAEVGPMPGEDSQAVEGRRGEMPDLGMPTGDMPTEDHYSARLDELPPGEMVMDET